MAKIEQGDPIFGSLLTYVSNAPPWVLRELVRFRRRFWTQSTMVRQKTIPQKVQNGEKEIKQEPVDEVLESSNSKRSRKASEDVSSKIVKLRKLFYDTSVEAIEAAPGEAVSELFKASEAILGDVPKTIKSPKSSPEKIHIKKENIDEDAPYPIFAKRKYTKIDKEEEYDDLPPRLTIVDPDDVPEVKKENIERPKGRWRKFFPESKNRPSKVKTNDRPFQCSECLNFYSTKKSLKVHMRIHTGNKPYKCDMCPKEFTQSNVLKAHINAHLGRRKYVCEVCQRAFIQSAHLRTHKQIHNDGEKFDPELEEKRALRRRKRREQRALARIKRLEEKQIMGDLSPRQEELLENERVKLNLEPEEKQKLELELLEAKRRQIQTINAKKGKLEQKLKSKKEKMEGRKKGKGVLHYNSVSSVMENARVLPENPVERAALLEQKFRAKEDRMELLARKKEEQDLNHLNSPVLENAEFSSAMPVCAIRSEASPTESVPEKTFEKAYLPELKFENAVLPELIPALDLRKSDESVMVTTQVLVIRFAPVS